MTATDSQSLIETYRPRRLSEVVGQTVVVARLREFVAQPCPMAFLFLGPTGVGKTSAVVALAHEMGVAVDAGPLGGFTTIAAGEQDGAAVRRAANALHLRPMLGSGWRVLAINEADTMTPQAAVCWLDVLEGLPANAVVCFTANGLAKLPDRFIDRCQVCEFESSPTILGPAVERLVAKIWKAERMRGNPPALIDLPLTDNVGNASIRRALRAVEVRIRQERQQRGSRRRSRVACPA